MRSSRGSKHSSAGSRTTSPSSVPEIGSAATRFTTVRFIDTNVLLYAISRDPAERAKAERANELLGARDLALSVQVLQEFYVQATRSTRQDRLSHVQASELVTAFTRFTVLDLTVPLVHPAK